MSFLKLLELMQEVALLFRFKQMICWLDQPDRCDNRFFRLTFEV